MSRVVFFGTAEFSLPTLHALIEGPFELAAVVTKPDSPAGRGRKLQRPQVATLAEGHSVPVLQPVSLDTAFITQLKELGAEVGVVVAYGKIIPQQVIDAFPHGIINIHASLLPQYRGPSPIEAAIVNGDHHTGVSIMQIDVHMDTGAVYAQEKVDLNGTETRLSLYDDLSRRGAQLLVASLPNIVDGSLKPRPQNDAEATIVPLVQKSDGIIKWEKPADRLEREIRAYLGWPGSRTRLLGSDVVITAARVVPGEGVPGEVMHGSKPTDPLFVYCGQDVLIIERLKPAGKNEMTASDFLRGRNLK